MKLILACVLLLSTCQSFALTIQTATVEIKYDNKLRLKVQKGDLWNEVINRIGHPTSSENFILLDDNSINLGRLDKYQPVKEDERWLFIYYFNNVVMVVTRREVNE